MESNVTTAFPLPPSSAGPSLTTAPLSAPLGVAGPVSSPSPSTLYRADHFGGACPAPISCSASGSSFAIHPCLPVPGQVPCGAPVEGTLSTSVGGSSSGPSASQSGTTCAGRSDAAAASPSPFQPNEASGQVSLGIRQRVSPITKHEKLRLAYVFCEGDTASGVIASRGPISRLQKDARTSSNTMCVVLVAEMFNVEKVFDVPAECADGGIDPDLHPHERNRE